MDIRDSSRSWRRAALRVLTCALVAVSFAACGGIEAAQVRSWLAELPGVTEVHDLHIWAMSTTESALTVHIVRPANDDGDAFLQAAEDGLHERFGIGHATLQVETDGERVCKLAPADVV